MAAHSCTDLSAIVIKRCSQKNKATTKHVNKGFAVIDFVFSLLECNYIRTRGSDNGGHNVP